jgi:hypothetical protein
MLAFQNGELLAKSRILQQKIMAGSKGPQKGAQQEPKEVEHGGQVITDGFSPAALMLLILKPEETCGEAQ